MPTSLQPAAIAISDEHSIVRLGIRYLLLEEKDLVVQKECESFEETAQLLMRHCFDLLIVDLNLKNRSIQQIRELTAQFPELPVLVFSMLPENPYATQVLRAGAKGYVHKKAAEQHLVAAIRTVLEGKTFLSPELRNILPVDTAVKPPLPQSPVASLSRREYEVFTLLAAGLTFKEIALQMGLSPKTVSTYRSRILEKTGLANANQLIQYALQESCI